MKLRLRLCSLAAASGPLLLTGCVGYNSTLFGTKTNVGLDLDTKTPTAEVSIARREFVVAPSFENGQSPPVAASFRVKGTWIASSISSTFAGGDAAATFAEHYNDPTPRGAAKKATDSTLRLSQEPVRKSGGKAKLQAPGTVRPFLFGTDTSFGVKVAWSGLTAQYPDSVKLGFNRKEMALAPVSGRTNITNSALYDVKMPSFLATTDTKGKAATPMQSEFSYVQYFATGMAADQLALREEVRTALAERMDPTAASKSELIRQREAALPDVANAQGAVDQIADAQKMAAAIDLFVANGWLAGDPAGALKTQANSDLPGVKEALKNNLARQGRDGKDETRVKIRKIADDMRHL